MPKKWSEVVSSPQFQALAPDQQEAARSQYFDQVVAPQISDPAQIQAARQQFDAQTAMAPRAEHQQTPEQLNALIQRQNLEDNGTGQNMLIGAGKSVNDTIQGIKQLGAMGVQGGATSLGQTLRGVGLNGLADAVGQNILVPAVQYGQKVQGQIDESKRLDAPLMDTKAGIAGNALGQIAQLAVPLGEVGALTRGAGLGTRIAASVPTGAAIGALQPVATGDSRALNAGIGAVLGPAGEALGAGVGALGRRAAAAVDPIRERALQVARDSGIPLHLSQVSESIPAKAMASMAQYLPFSGAGKAASNQQAAFNRAVARTFGANSDQLGDDVMRQARQNLSRQFEDIYSRNDVPLKPDDLRALARIEGSAAQRLTEPEAKVVQNQMDAILREINDAGALTGQKYQALRSSIMKAEGPDKVGGAVSELRKALDDIAAKAVGPEDSATLKRLRGQWANFRTIENVLKQVAGAGGDVRPSSLWPAIRRGSTQEMRDLARLGQTIMKNPVPDSGTAGRLAATSMLGTGGLAAGGGLPGLLGLIAGGATVGRALNSSALARLATATTPTPVLNGLARLLPPSALAATPAAASAVEPRKTP